MVKSTKTESPPVWLRVEKGFMEFFLSDIKVYKNTTASRGEKNKKLAYGFIKVSRAF